MKKVLYIVANPQAETQSYSKRAGTYYLEQLKKNQDVEVTVFDVYEEFVPLVDGDVLSAWGALGQGQAFTELTGEQQKKVGRMGEIIEQFKASDEYVIVTPLWNFSVAPMLKAYIDNVVIAGQTFKYTENGPVGLLENKKATIIQASGGFYSEEPMAAFNHGNKYLEQVLGFMGVAKIDHVSLEGIAVPGPTVDERLSAAYTKIEGILALA